MTEVISTARLDALHPCPINVRANGVGEGVEETIASIAAHNLLYPLICRRMPGNPLAFEVVDGRRRLEALKKAAGRGDFDGVGGELLVPIILRDLTDEDAREISLAANVLRLPLHPIDQFEAFAALFDDGMTAETVAARFGVSEKMVRQRMALGSLAAPIRAAWRTGMSDEAAKAFTLCRTAKEQLEIFNRLKKKDSLYGHAVYQELGVNLDASRCYAFVGEDAYRAAGGKAVIDLFGDLHVLSDPKLAQRLAADKLKGECERLIAEGWGFAKPKAEIKDFWKWREVKPSGKPELNEEQAAQRAKLQEEHNWLSNAEAIDDEQADRLEELEGKLVQFDEAAKRGTFTDRQKKNSGCVLEIERDGSLTVTYGVKEPVDEKKPAKGKKAKPDEADDARGEDAAAAPAEEPPGLTNAMALALSEQRTIAAAEVLSEDPILALHALLAHFLVDGNAVSPLKIGRHGLAALTDDSDGEPYDEFAHPFAMVRAETNGVADACNVLAANLAPFIAQALDFSRHSASEPANPGADALIAAMEAEAWRAAALRVFQPTAYFAGVSKALCEAAADELDIAADRRPKKKAELAALCAEEAKAKQWLPKELRQ